MAITDELIAKITLETKGSRKSVSALFKDINKLDNGLSGLHKTIGNLGVGFIALNQTMELSNRIFLGVQGVVRNTLGAYKDYEKGLIGISKTTG